MLPSPLTSPPKPPNYHLAGDTPLSQFPHKSRWHPFLGAEHHGFWRARLFCAGYRPAPASLPTGSNLDWGAPESVKVSGIVATPNLATVPCLLNAVYIVQLGRVGVAGLRTRTSSD